MRVTKLQCLPAKAWGVKALGEADLTPDEVRGRVSGFLEKELDSFILQDGRTARDAVVEYVRDLSACLSRCSTTQNNAI